mmetsp:Transcript_8590/g.12664  ORF Transcript_8590/g.12664 Transcript_8590/m.12664 type:complete len:400 (-) Transcript_8590:17-1216(-)
MQQTILVQKTISDMSKAQDMFGVKNSDGTLPLVLIPSRPLLQFWVTIPDSVYVIMQKWGKPLPRPKPGLQLVAPWTKVAYIVSNQGNAYNAPVKNCPTKDNVMVTVDLTVIFRIEDPEKFVYDLGAMQFDGLLQAATEESIRGLVRATSHDRVYELRSSGASEFLERLNDKFTCFGVKFTDATITNVILPPELASTLQNETTYDSKQKEEVKSHQFQIKLLNDEADLEMKQLKAENHREAQDEVARKARTLIKKQQQEIEAQRKKQLAIIKAEEEAATRKYKAQSELSNAKIQGEKEAAEITLKAEGQAQAERIEIDQYAEVELTKSRARLAASANHAKALEVEADIEEKAAIQLKERRAHDIAMRKMDALQGMAKSGKIVISGEHGDRVIKEITQSVS